MSINRGMDKEVVAHTQPLKQNEIRPFAAIWRDLESVTLREVSLTEEEKYHMIFLICEI